MTYMPMHNSDVECTAVGKVIFNKGDQQTGIRYTPAAGTRQAVANIKVSFTRSYRPQGVTEFTHIKSYVEFALWGPRAESFINALARYGDLQTVLRTMEVRVKVGFSLADLGTHLWGEPLKADITCKAQSLELVYCEVHDFGDNPEVRLVSAPVEEDLEVAL